MATSLRAAHVGDYSFIQRRVHLATTHISKQSTTNCDSSKYDSDGQQCIPFFRLCTKPFKVDTDTLWCMCMHCVDLYIDIFVRPCNGEARHVQHVVDERLVCCQK